MKTNWEKDIKKQLENREVKVSDDARQRFEEMANGIKVPQKSKLRMVWAVAAAVLLLAGILSVSRLMSDGNSEAPAEIPVTPMVHTEETSDFPEQPKWSEDSDSTKRNSVSGQTEGAVREKERLHSDLPDPAEIKNRERLENELSSEPVEIAITNEFPAVQEDTLTRWEESLLTSSDQPKEPEIKASYTDPELLLYSVENDEVIKQKRTGARIVLIDFNK